MLLSLEMVKEVIDGKVVDGRDLNDKGNFLGDMGAEEFQELIELKRAIEK